MFVDLEAGGGGGWFSVRTDGNFPVVVFSGFIFSLDVPPLVLSSDFCLMIKLFPVPLFGLSMCLSTFPFKFYFHESSVLFLFVLLFPSTPH